MLQIREKALGAEHPDVAQSLNNLAILHSAQGEYAAAAPLFERALRILEKTVGAEHPDFAGTLESYSRLLRKLGRDDEAAAMEARAEASRARHAEREARRQV